MHACALRTDGTIACWGADDLLEVPAGAYTAVAAGFAHACAIGADGAIACWGNNEWNDWFGPRVRGSQRLGGQTDAPAGAYTAVAAGHAHSCALRTDATIACWGNNDNGQTEAPAGAYTAITAGGAHSCALRADDTITCWGFLALDWRSGTGDGQS